MIQIDDTINTDYMVGIDDMLENGDYPARCAKYILCDIMKKFCDESGGGLLNLDFADIQTFINKAENVSISTAYGQDTTSALKKAGELIEEDKRNTATDILVMFAVPGSAGLPRFDEAVQGLFPKSGINMVFGIWLHEHISECFVVFACAESTQEDSKTSNADGISCFRLAEGSKLVPLAEEWRKLAPSVWETGQIRVYDANNHYIDFNRYVKWFESDNALISLLRHGDDYVNYFLAYDDEKDEHVFACYADLRDLDAKILNPYKMDNRLLAALKQFWENEDECLKKQFNKLEHQERGAFGKFIAKHKSWLCFGLKILVAVIILYFAFIGVLEFAGN